ncbi:hypothetical protein FAIPA1_190048 [Frankia sp. AiPs1]
MTLPCSMRMSASRSPGTGAVAPDRSCRLRSICAALNASTMPNTVKRTCVPRWPAISAPATAPTTVATSRVTATRRFAKPSSRYRGEAAALPATTEISEAPIASRTSSPKARVRMGTMNVPPPSPSRLPRAPDATHTAVMTVISANGLIGSTPFSRAHSLYVCYRAYLFQIYGASDMADCSPGCRVPVGWVWWARWGPLACSSRSAARRPPRMRREDGWWYGAGHGM